MSLLNQEMYRRAYLISYLEACPNALLRSNDAIDDSLVVIIPKNIYLTFSTSYTYKIMIQQLQI